MKVYLRIKHVLRLKFCCYFQGPAYCMKTHHFIKILTSMPDMCTLGNVLAFTSLKFCNVTQQIRYFS